MIESIHPKESSNRQIIREACPAMDDSTRSIERDIVKIHPGNAIDAQSFFHDSLPNIEPHESSQALMEYAAGRARIYDCLKPFGAGSILDGKRDANVQYGGSSGSTAPKRKRLIG